MKLKFILLSLLAIAVFLGVVLAYFTGDIFSRSPEKIPSKNIAVVKDDEGSHLKIQLIRHATVVIMMDGKKILIDPMFANTGSLPSIPLTFNRVKNPLIPLHVNKENLVAELDAVLLTHNHPDHIDAAALEILPKDILFFCQPDDEEILNMSGFTNTQVIDEKFDWENITIRRFTSNHAEGAMNEDLGNSSSFYMALKDKSLFITGDAILDETLEKSLNETQASLILANAGSAQFIIGEPVTLTSNALKKISQMLPKSKILAVHMDAINHCSLTKENLRSFLSKEERVGNILVPDEGEIFSF